MRIYYIMAMCLLTSLCIFGQDRRGLVIGLGQYQDEILGTIHGDRDVLIVKNMLNKCGYTDLVSLTNSQATKSSILTAFNSLVNRCRKGDIVYIHFSGHGQQITDVNGDEKDEKGNDNWDEAWIPYDAMYAYSQFYKGENHLINDEISSGMTKIQNKIGSSGSLLLVVDTCHSGDSSRDGLGDEEVYIRGAEKDFVIPLKTSNPLRGRIK